jgi:hypothetical protein
MRRRLVSPSVLLVVASALVCVSFAACPEASEDEDQGDGDGDGEDGGDGEDDDDDGQCGPETQKPLPGAGAVYFGTREPTHVQLSPAQMRAIVGIGENPPPGAECSGTLIAADVVLTATHCTEGIRATNFYVTFGEDDYDPELVVDVIEKNEHPEYDITMLRLAFAPATQIDVAPIPAFAGQLGTADFGEIFEQSGFGQTETGDSNGRLFVAEPFDSFEDGGYLVVNGEGRHGVCFGDSGGPSLRQTADAGVRVVGALSWGDPTCTGYDRYTRVDLVQDWIGSYAGEIPGGGPVPCGVVDVRGRCSNDGRAATFCGDSSLRHDTCAEEEVCHDDGDRARCIPVADAPCGALTAVGACDGDVLSWCDDDVLRVRDCAACGGQLCVHVDDVVGFGCVDNHCGDLDFRGECAGDVARWCNDGEIATEDCAAQGSTCGFVDEDTGFYCR